MKSKSTSILFASVSGYLLLLIVLPVGAIFEQAFSGGWNGFVTEVSQPMALAAFRITIETGLLAAVMNTVAGTLMAYVIQKDKIPGGMALNAMIDMPFAIPTTVSGLMFIFLYGPNSPIGKWFLSHGVTIIYSPIAIVLAMVFVTFPYTVRAVQPLLEETHQGMEEAARTLGAGNFRVLRTILLPTIAPGILTGFTLSFSRAMAEFGAVVMIAGNKPMHTQVAAVYLYGLFENYDQRGAAAISVVLLAVALLALLYQFYVLHHKPSGRIRTLFYKQKLTRKRGDAHDSADCNV